MATGDARPADLDRGWFVEPTIFANVTASMRIAQEEIFGLVVSVITYDDEEQSVAIANDSNYGLSGSVHTSDPSSSTEPRRTRRRTESFDR